jgi:16S rRNA (cytosine1407-C5)-methyltransferase
MDKRFLDRLQVIFPDSFSDVKESFAVQRLPVVRVNTLVVREEEGVKRLVELGFEPEKVVEKNAYIVHGRTKRELTETDEYLNGWYYIQSVSSMVPVWSIEEEVRERVDRGDDLMVLDMCAAPGSKTSQLAAVMEGKGQIIALDVSRQRLYALADNMEQQRASNVFPTLGNGAGVWKKYGPMFDLVMLDAPCSGEGRFSILDSRDADEWSLNRVERLAIEQRRLVFAAAMCVKQGGLLVYSTCTFAPEENEEIIQFVLGKFEGSFEVLHMPLVDLYPEIFLPGLSEWNGKVFDPRISHSLRVKPDTLWEGFFVTVLRRN